MLNKKDPLLDVVTGVMSESDATRMAIEAANKHFGVTSRKALPHELHEAYDKVVAESVKFYDKGNETRPKKDRGDEKKVDRFKNALKKAPVVRKKDTGETVHESAETLEERNVLKATAAGLKAAGHSFGQDMKYVAPIGVVTGLSAAAMTAQGMAPPEVGYPAAAASVLSGPAIATVGAVKAGIRAYRDKKSNLDYGDKQAEEQLKIHKQTIKDAAARAKDGDKSRTLSVKRARSVKESVFDEIRTNILNEMATITDEEKLMSYIDNLSEEQMDILGLAEASDKKKPESSAEEKKEGGLVKMPPVPKPKVSVQDRQMGAQGASGMDTQKQVSARPATGLAARTQTRATTPRK